MSPAAITPEMSESVVGPPPCTASRFPVLRSVRWRINLGVLPSSVNCTVDDLRRVTADSRRRYAGLRRRLLIDPHITKFGNDSPDLSIDNPLSQNPDSTWGRFFRNAELEKMVDKDLSRLYPEHGSYFQTPGCQGLLRRVLLLWCLRHPECGYRQGMHELLAPLIYVLHADIQHLTEVRKLYEDHFVDKFDEDLLNESLDFNLKISSKFEEDIIGFQEKSKKQPSITDLDANLQNIVLLSDPYGAEGELGIVLSEKFMEHDAYCMFDAIMNGSGGAVAMAEFVSHSPASTTHSGFPPVIEASLSLYHLLSIVDTSLYSHLIELGVEPQYFALRWLRVLFGREFSLEDLLIIWDEIFSFDNSKFVTSELDSGVSNSPRGAFISAMAVSMMLSVRPSLLATELATSCLQRLLNFPEQVDLDKLIGKAKSLVPLAIDANVPSHSVPMSGHDNYVKEMGSKGLAHSVSFDSSSLHTPVNVVPESYWEGKWRLIQKEEETKKEKGTKQASPHKRGWAEKIKSKLSRTESDPNPGKRESKERVKKPSVRRSLLDDLSRQLNAEEDAEESRHDNLPFPEDPLHVNSDLGVADAGQEAAAYIGNSGSGLSTASEEQSPVFSEPASPLGNGSEKSSIASNVSNDINDGETENSSSFQSTTEEPPLPVSDAPDLKASEACGSDDSSRDVSAVIPKERKTLSGRFQWLWKFGQHNSSEGEGTSEKKFEVENGRHNSGEDEGMSDKKLEVENGRHNSAEGEGTSDKKFEVENGQHNSAEGVGTSDTKFEVENEISDDDASLQGNKAETYISEINCDYVNLKTDGCDQNMVCALRNLGQSMLENIQSFKHLSEAAEKGKAWEWDELREGKPGSGLSLERGEVIESAFQAERSQAGSQDQLSKHALVEKGQVTAMTALKELRKISHLLREV